MKIYTKTGDKGETGIIGGRISKASPLIELIGNLDELNAALGICIATSVDSDSVRAIHGLSLQKIQNSLFDIGALLAGSKKEIDFEKIIIDLETQIDAWDKELPPLQNFILPGGSLAASQIHLARTICRRVERNFVTYIETYDTKDFITHSMKFLNRLSDYLFVMARVVNKELGVDDVIWK